MPILHMQTEEVRNTGRLLARTADTLDHHAQELNRALYTLQNSWHGSSSDRFAGEMSQLLQTINQTADAGALLSQRVQTEVDEWEAIDNNWETNISGELSQFDDVAFLSGEISAIGFMLGGEGGPSAWANMSWGDTTGVKGHSQDFLIHGYKIDLQERYRAGEMTFSELAQALNEVDNSLKLDYVKTDLTLYQLYKGEQKAGAATWKDSASGKWGNLSGEFLSAEAKSAQSIKFGKEGIEAKVDAEAGLYLARAEYDAEFAGVDVAVDGYLGANAQGSAEAKFNPLAGDAALAVGVGAFAGGRIDGSVDKDFDVAGVKTNLGARGSVSYGIGGKFEADIGLDDGVFKADVDVGATVGLGGELGFTVELDVQDAAENVVDAAADGAEWLWNEIF